jgi:hypothetical protein
MFGGLYKLYGIIYLRGESERHYEPPPAAARICRNYERQINCPYVMLQVRWNSAGIPLVLR